MFRVPTRAAPCSSPHLSCFVFESPLKLLRVRVPTQSAPPTEARFIALLDMDEIIMPNNAEDWPHLFQQIATANNLRLDDIDVMSFQHHYFFENNTRGKDVSGKFSFRILDSNLRSVSDLGTRQRKLIYNTRRALRVFNHYPINCVDGHCDHYIRVPQTLARMNHYRASCRKITLSTDKCKEMHQNVIEDNRFSFASAGKFSKIIMALKSKEALGLDGIPVYVLKKGVEVLASPIAHLVNRSLATRVVPTNFETGPVIPVYKGKGMCPSKPSALSKDARTLFIHNARDNIRATQCQQTCDWVDRTNYCKQRWAAGQWGAADEAPVSVAAVKASKVRKMVVARLLEGAALVAAKRPSVFRRFLSLPPILTLHQRQDRLQPEAEQKEEEDGQETLHSS
eukprot:maker-scaffold822_size92092-snap-gene-0.19 protein:Tk03448 transcript:maker-scaffold822_size92092-snap-gene-0.19-mRNA-1 annotation:"GK16244"